MKLQTLTIRILLTVAYYCVLQTLFSQNASLSLEVFDNEIELYGASVTLLDLEGNIKSSDFTNAEGKVVLEIEPGNYELRVTYIGYKDYKEQVNLNPAELKKLAIELEEGLLLETLVVTFDKSLGKKSIEIPASISTINSEEFELIPAMGPETRLQKLKGIHLTTVGVDRSEIALRGLNQPFNNRILVLTDFLNRSVASSGGVIFNAMNIPVIDMERIEIVRGGVGATYGPGAVYGAVHFITKSPFDAPGTTVQLFGGSQSHLGTAVRHADVLGNKKNIGYKLVAEWSTAKEWEFDPNDPEDFNTISGDIIDRGYTSKKLRFKNEIRVRLGKKKQTEIINTLAYSQAKFLLHTPNPIHVTRSNVLTEQIRVRSGNFWGQLYLSKGFPEPSLIVNVADPNRSTPTPYGIKSKSLNWGGQAQYAFDLWDNRQKIILGGDYNRINPNSSGTSYGRFENRTLSKTYGFYLNSNTDLIQDQLSLIASARVDMNRFNSDGVMISPFIGLNYHLTNKHSFRISGQKGWTNIPLGRYFSDTGFSGFRDME